MRNCRFIILAFGLNLLSPGGSGGAQPTDPPAAAPAEDELEASRSALDALDAGQLMRDRDYAAQMLGHIDRMAANVRDNAELSSALEGLRIAALVTLERREEVRSFVERLLLRRPREPRAYGGAIYAAAAAAFEPSLAVRLIETASRNVPGIAWSDLRPYVDRGLVQSLLRQLAAGGQSELRVRLAESLFRIGWPGGADALMADRVRSILVEDRLERGDERAAADFAAGLTTPDGVVRMIVQPRYDAVLGPGRDRLEVLRRTLVDHDRATAEALAAAPDDPKRRLERVRHLRSVGRNAEAMALLEPLTRDAAAAGAGSEEGMRLVNEAAFALVALGRHEEGGALMAQLAALPLDEHPWLISASTNYAEILFDTGRHAEALAHALSLQRDAADHASDYGEMMWISAVAVCSLARLGRAAEAPPHLDRMRPLSDANPAALTQAYLCLGDDDAAAALMVSRLQGADPAPALLALQDYSLSSGLPQRGPLSARLTALRERPAVRAALARTGRLLTLPLSRSYWGSY